MAFLDDLFGLSGKVALVTGGATGIGRMASEALVRAGARVLIASRKGEACEAVARELNALGAPGSAEGFAGDVANEAGIKALVAEVRKRTDVLHILFNNAGRSWGAPLEDFPHSAWESVMALNVAGPFTLTRDLVPLLEKGASADDPARVVNVGSIMGHTPMGEGAYSYAASKAAVHHITRIFALELAEKQITCNAFAPGPFLSKMTAFAIGSEEGAARSAKRVPMGRIGRPSDIMGSILYFCGRGGAYTTGCILPIDGGMSVRTGPRLFAGDE